MKLSECTHGKLVVNEYNLKIGMVVGISENSFNEAIPVIQWQDEITCSCHHTNLYLYEE
jgi:hypothetical protein